MGYRLTEAERNVRKARNYGGKEVWWYVGRSVCDIYFHVVDGIIVRASIGTRYVRNALKQMDKELNEQKGREWLKGK